MPVPAIIAGGVAIGGSIAKGVAQKRAARRAEKSANKMFKKGTKMADAAMKFKEDNPYEIPEEAYSALSLAQNELGTSALQTNMERQADRALAGKLSAVERTATSGADALAAATGVYSQSQDDYTNAAVAGAQERSADINNLMNAQSMLADYRSIQYDQNINMPYLQRMELAQGITGAGLNAQSAAQQAKAQTAGVFGDSLIAGSQAFSSLYGAGAFNKKPA